jgi:acyl-CoA thioesterase-1
MIRFLSVLLLFVATAAQGAQTVLVFGDSLSAGYGIAVDKSWPALLAKRLEAEKRPWQVVNASISGETSAGGRSRLPAALERHKPALVVLALGTNDGLRGLTTDQLQDNLAAMIRAARAAKARVLLVGMKLPPNYGPRYAAAFEATYRDLARRERIPLLPFLLEPIALDAAAFQSDNLHPTAPAQPKILNHVWESLRPLL